jgi:O-methyltransferase involved in polyketide biosynthesis
VKFTDVDGSGGEDAAMAIKPELTGLPETALWTLWFRAQESRRPDAVLTDPVAVEVLDKIDFPYESRFGRLFPAQAMSLALRVLGFDGEIRRFLAEHPGGQVVALGEGLETQFWRVDNGAVRWLTVDLPESVALRRQLMPAHERQNTFAGSALDPAWMDAVRPPVLITAQGLLMYLPPADVRALILQCARRFPGGRLVFDSVPPWLGRLVARGTSGYTPPPMLWTLRAAEMGSLAALDPAIVDVREVTPPTGRGLAGRLLPRWRRIPLLGRYRPVMASVQFGE